MEVVHLQLGIVVIAPVPQRVDAGQVAGGGEELAPGVVGVGGDAVSAAVQDAHNVSLQVGQIVIGDGRCGGTGLIREGTGIAALIVEKLQLFAVVILGDKLAALPEVLVLHAAHGFGQAQAVAVVGVGDGQTGIGRACQSASVCPGEGGPVVPGGGVADGVIADGISVVGRQQVQPLAVPIGISIGICAVSLRSEIAVGIVGIGPGGITHGLRQELALVVVGIGCVGAAADGGDVAQGVVSVVILADGPAAGIPVGQAAHQQRGAVGACACQIAQLAIKRWKERKLPPSVSSLKGKNVSHNFVNSQNVHKRRIESVMYEQASSLDIHSICREYPETFKGLGLSQQAAFCPQKAMLASMIRVPRKDIIKRPF